MDILSTFCGVFMVQCVELMLRFFEFVVLQSNCFVYHQTVTRLKRFTRYGHYTGEVEDITLGRLTVVSSVAVQKIRAFSCGLTTLC